MVTAVATHLTPASIDPRAEVDVSAAVYAAHRLILDPNAPVVKRADERKDALDRDLLEALGVIDALPRWRALAHKAVTMR